MTNDIRMKLHLDGEPAATRGMDNYAKATDRAGDSVTELAKDSGHLTKKISETRAEIEKLTKAFNESGDMDLLKKIRKERSNLRSLEGLLPKPAEVAAAAAEVGSKAGVAVSSALSDAIRSSKGMLVPPLIAIGVAAAPAIGAGISAAVLGAAGAGGIVGGIVAASQDQQVQDAAKQVGIHVSSALTQAGSAFVGPLIESLNVLDSAGDRLAASFGQISEKLAPTLVPLTEGLAGFVDELMPGIVRAADAMRPVIRAMGAELPKIGMAVGEFFDKISEDPDEAVMGIVAISQAIQGTIEAAGTLIDKLGGIFAWSSRTGAAISETWEGLFGWLPIAGDAIKDQGRNFREQRDAINGANDASQDFVNGGIRPIIKAEEEVAKVTRTATEEIEDQITAMDRMFGRVMDSRELARNYQESIDDLTESVNKHGKSLDISTDKGRANAEALDKQAEAIKAIRDDMIRKTGDVAAADAAFLQMVETLRKQALALGMNKDAVNDFINALLAMPRQADVEFRAPGLLEALDRAQRLNRLMGGIAAGSRGLGAGQGTFKQGGDDSGLLGGRHTGGPMYPGQSYRVGEHGVEVVSMHAGGGATVYTAAQSEAMTMSGASGGSAPGGGTTVVLRASDAAVQALLNMLDFRIEQVIDNEAALSAGGPR